MIQHFFNPLVLVFYAAMMGFNGFEIFRVDWFMVLLQGFFLVFIDFAVHKLNHKWEHIYLPFPSIFWVVNVAVCTKSGLIYHGWQLSALFFAQAWWDNSWHSVYNHRPERKPITHTDHQWIRVAAVIVLVGIIELPQLLLK